MIIRSASEYGSLFPSGEHKAEGLFNTSANVNQYSFYGRCLGFHVSIDFPFFCCSFDLFHFTQNATTIDNRQQIRKLNLFFLNR